MFKLISFPFSSPSIQIKGEKKRVMMTMVMTTFVMSKMVMMVITMIMMKTKMMTMMTVTKMIMMTIYIIIKGVIVIMPSRDNFNNIMLPIIPIVRFFTLELVSII